MSASSCFSSSHSTCWRYGAKLMSSRHELSQSGRDGLQMVTGASERESPSRRSYGPTLLVVPARKMDPTSSRAVCEDAQMIWLCNGPILKHRKLGSCPRDEETGEKTAKMKSRHELRNPFG